MKPKKKHSAPLFDLQSVTSGISTTLVLLLLGLVMFFVLTAGNLSVYVREHINFSIILSDDMQERDILRMQKALGNQPFIRSTQYISKEQALKEQTEAMGTDPKEFLGYNPFSASIEVKLKSEYTNADSIARIEKLIKKEDGFLDFYDEADKIYGKVRGLAHNPGCFFFLDKNRIKVLKAKLSEKKCDENTVLDEKKSFVIGCKNGAVEILELISPTGKKMSGNAFLNGYHGLLKVNDAS